VNDSFAFAVFVALFCGGLAVVTIGMACIAMVLVRRHRRKRERPRSQAAVLPESRDQEPRKCEENEHGRDPLGDGHPHGT
jgi:hypothetical protein